MNSIIEQLHQLTPFKKKLLAERRQKNIPIKSKATTEQIKCQNSKRVQYLIFKLKVVFGISQFIISIF